MACSTRTLRYSSAMAWRVRSATCSKQTLSLRRLQACSQRKVHTHTSRGQYSGRLALSQSVLSRSIPTNKVESASGVRHRSFWGRDYISRWDRRRQSFWHRPGCRWVNSNGDPHTTPRDKECPACREDEMSPQELAPREIMWQRKLHIMKEMFEKDPYRAFFGCSNDRLRGIYPGRYWSNFNRLLGTEWAESIRERRERARGQEHETLKPATEVSKEHVAKEKPTTEAQEKTAQARKKSADNNNQVYREEVKEFVINQTTKPGDKEPTIKGYGTWKVSGRNAESTYEASGELEFDPITMRMVPKQPSSASETPKTNMAIEKAKDAAVQIPVIKTSGVVAANPKEQSSRTSIEVAKQTLNPHALPLGKAIIHNRASERASTTSQPSINLPEPPNLNLSKSGPSLASRSQEPILAKAALEQSWVRENATRRRQRVEDSTDRDGPHVGRIESKSGKFAGGAPLPQKNRPLKHMNASELGRHRAALIKAWSRRHKKPVEETAADRMLKEEVNKQKLAMNAFENKWRTRTPTTATPASTASNTSSEKPVEMLPGEGDVCPNVAKYAKSARWYKEKAPHALVHERTKLEDIALVRSVREIYENVYGVIDTNHRQMAPKVIPPHGSTNVEQTSKISDLAPSSENTPMTSTSSRTQKRTTSQLSEGSGAEKASEPQVSVESKPKVDPALYKILAYDQSEKSMLVATASSSYSPPTGERIMSVSDALVRLHSPTKYFPYLATHQAGGYEIVSSNKNLLVLKRVHPVDPSETTPSSASSSKASAEIARPNVNPIDGTSYAHLTTQTGNFASPTGFVNHDVYSEQTAASNSTQQEAATLSNGTSPKVKREEPVFSGQKNRDESTSSKTSDNQSISQGRVMFRRRYRRMRKIIRRVVSIGAFTALCCYITGVIVESLREVNAKNNKSETSSDKSERRRRFHRRDAPGAAEGTSAARRDQLTAEEEKIYMAAKAFVAGAVLLPVVKYLFKSR